MGNRKLPFGYRMVDGQVDIHPQEAELVQAIFRQYLANASIKQIAARLDTQPVRYDGQKTWNKNMIARIIEDPRYVGEKSFPAIIDPDTLSAAINLKQLSIDEDWAKQLAFSAATSQYLLIENSTYETRRIQRLVADAEIQAGLDADLLRSLAASIQVSADGCVTLTLRNGQRIGGGSE